MPQAPIHEIERIAVPDAANQKGAEVAHHGNGQPVARAEDFVIHENAGLENIHPQKQRKGHMPAPPKFGQVARQVRRIEIFGRADAQ